MKRFLLSLISTSLSLLSLNGFAESAPPEPDALPPYQSDFNFDKRIKNHWSWSPVTTPPIPQVQNALWPAHPIDHFILAKLEAAGLTPAQPADKATWLRRIYFDITGLPPTPAQLDEFIHNENPDARRSVIEQLLSSHGFGEKWGRHWLDLVRFSETSGHENNYPIPDAFRYRDYVIRALNSDVPYDQFVREHIAGDLIGTPRLHPVEKSNESIIGTGFWYFHQSAPFPPDSLGNEADIIDNQLDVFGKTFLGLTVACARCHDHKTDAITMEDYYALSSYLQSSTQQTAHLDPQNQIARHHESTATLLNSAWSTLAKNPEPDPKLGTMEAAYFESAHDLTTRKSQSDNKDLKEIPGEWITEVATSKKLNPDLLKRWIHHLTGITHIRIHPEMENKASANVFESFDGDGIPEGWSQSGNGYVHIPAQSLAPDGGILKPGSISSRRFGTNQISTLRSPTFTITTPQIHMLVRASAGMQIQLVINSYRLAVHRDLLFAGTVLHGNQTDTRGNWEWLSFNRDLSKYIGHRAHIEFIDANDGFIEVDEIRLSQSPPSDKQFLISDNSSFANRWQASINHYRNGSIDPLMQRLLELGLVNPDVLSAKAAAQLKAARDHANASPKPVPVLAMAQTPPEKAFIYKRGNHFNPGRPVSGRTLKAFGGKHGDRMALAESITSRDNPLTARVMVNRIWHHLMGRGIVTSTDDFGSMGTLPSHPHLLDWLAQEFVQSNWSIKHMVYLIASSSTYGQSSIPHQTTRSRVPTADPQNLLWHRMPVRRLPAESIRDSLLFVSGRMDLQHYGLSTQVHLTPFMLDCELPPTNGPLDGNGRRTIYQQVDRNFLNPLLLTFDTPSPFGTLGCRSKSNVPAQALSLLNDPFVIQQAEFWAAHILALPDTSPDQKVSLMIRMAHGTSPTHSQIQRMLEFLKSQSALYGANDRKAWNDLAHAIFNMKAFSYIR